MIRTHVFPCALPKDAADALNRESGRVYMRALVEHYRVYRQTGHWLSPAALEKLVDFYDAQDGQERLLHAHSMDAAEQGFPKACKTARANRGDGAHYPHKRKFWRTTIWKNTGIRKRDGALLLARARGQDTVRLILPSNLASIPAASFAEMRLVWDKAARHYFWHLVVDDGQQPAEAPGTNVAAVDLGEIHPATVTDGAETIVITARALRSVGQHTHKRLAEIQRKQAVKKKGSLAWKRLQRRKSRFLAQQTRRKRDIEHKVSRAVVDWAAEHEIGTLVIGDVRDVADGKRLGRKSQQKVSNWSHGRQREYITYKAAAEGIGVELENEAYTSQTCPSCGKRHKPTGRVCYCPACGFVSHRDAIGSVNILSRHLQGEVGHVKPPSTIKYRQPFGRAHHQETEWTFALREGKRSPSDTGQVAAAAVVARHAHQSAEAAPL